MKKFDLSVSLLFLIWEQHYKFPQNHWQLMSLLRKLTEQFIKFLDILNMDAAMEEIKLAKETLLLPL